MLELMIGLFRAWGLDKVCGRAFGRALSLSLTASWGPSSGGSNGY